MNALAHTSSGGVVISSVETRALARVVRRPCEVDSIEIARSIDRSIDRAIDRAMTCGRFQSFREVVTLFYISTEMRRKHVENTSKTRRKKARARAPPPIGGLLTPNS